MVDWEVLKNVIYVDKVYGGISEIRRRMLEPRMSEVDLSLAEYRIFSQNGEDGILNEILRNIDVENLFFVEFGVGDGWSCNTRLLAEVFGWRGTFIEVEREDFSKLQARYKNCNRVTTLCDKITPENINDLFRKAKVPQEFGVLSIDIDGQDYWVWQALDQFFSPAVVIIEVNLDFGLERPVTEAQGTEQTSLTETFGASIRSLEKLGNSKGYELVHIDLAGVNAFFVHRQRLKSVEFKGITDRSPNYGLRGTFHDVQTLYAGDAGNPRAVVDV